MPFKTILKMMVLLFPALLNAAQSLSGGSGSATLPAGAPFSNLTNIRFEIRLHNWSYNGTYQPLYESNSFYIRIFPSNTVVLTSWDDSSLACSASVVSGTDAIFRFQRDAANSRLTCEAFNTQTGASIFTGTSGFPTPQTPSDAGSNLTVGSTPDIAYIRVSSTVVAPGTVPGNTYNGDLLDYEFEGNGTDRAGHANLTLSSPAYVTTPVYAPAAVFNPWPTINTFRAGASMQLDARNSFTSTDNATLRYFWQQLSGPLTGTFSNRTSATPAFSASLAGTYGLQLTVTDSGGLSSVTTANIGAVATDSNGVVVTGLSAADNLLGPVIQAGQSPWMYWDLAEEGTATAIGTAALANPPIRGAQIAGSFSATQGSATVTGPTGALTVGEGVIIAWNAVTDGNGAGNYLDSVQSITDSTHFVLNQANNTGQGFIPPSGTGLSMYQLPVDTPTQILGLWDNGNALNWWNFYDDPVGFYRLWQRTGRTAFLTTARALADYNWAWLLDHGYNHNSPPRGSSLLGQFVRALDGHPERIPLLYSYINFYQTSFSFGHPTPGTFDNREMGYSIWWLALGAKVDTDPAHHTWYCNAMANVLTETGGILADQYANGSWGENVYSGNPGYPYPPLTTTPLVFGNSPWRQNLLIKGLEADYESLADTTAQGCNNTTVAAQVLTAIEAGVNFEYNYGRDSGNRGIFYDVNYPGDAQSAKTPYNTNGNGTPPIFTITAVSAANPAVLTLSSAPAVAFPVGSIIVIQGGSGSGCSGINTSWAIVAASGTSVTIPYNATGCTYTVSSAIFNSNVSVSLGSTAVVGVGTNFLTLFKCDGTDWIGFTNSATVYHVTSCTDDTRLTLTTAFGAQNEGSAVVNSSYSWVPTNNTSCGTSLAAYCKAGGGDLNLVRLAAGATAWVYNKTGIAGYKTKADEWFATAFGGPAAGPTASTTLNTFSTPCPGRGCGGPNASGWIGDSAGSLPDCNTSPAPCTNNGSGPFGYLGKNFGEAAGAPGADNELAWRLGGLAPSVNRTLYVSFNLASVPNATQVKVTLTEPDGAVVTGTCSSSPCAVETDARQGNDAGQTAYLSATGAVLALGDPTVFVVE